MKLMLCVYLPLLPLEALRPRWSEPGAYVVVHDGVVCSRSLEAAHAGVHVGMRAAGAAAVAPSTIQLERKLDLEQQRLDAVAMALMQYTPEVTFPDAESVLLDVSASLRLFNGPVETCHRVMRSLMTLGFSAQLGAAPTAKAAWLLARQERLKRVVLRRRAVSTGTMELLLNRLPLHLLPSIRQHQAWFDGIGARSLGALRRLPRAGLIRRTSKDLVHDLDCAYGLTPELHEWIQTPDVFSARIETFERVEHADALLDGAKGLLLQLIGWLTSRQLAVRRFTLALEHERGRAAVAPTLLEVALAEPAWRDEHLVAGVVKAHVRAKELGLPLVIGSQMVVTPEDGSPAFWLIILAMTKNGYGNLSELITTARMRSEKGTYLIHPRDIAAPVGDLVHLRGLPDCQVILAPRYNAPVEEVERQAAWLVQCAPGRARIALSLHHRAKDENQKVMVRAVAEVYGLPIVATGDVCMHVRSYKPVQDVMTAIRHRLPVSDCGYRLFPNAEQHLRSIVRLANLYPREALEEAARVARLCTFSLDELHYEYPHELVPEGETATSYLRSEAYIGAHWRYPNGVPANVVELLERELELIAEMQYEPYFLTVYDIVRFARSKHILCQGRGSAANSAVCFCLGVTEVDPSRGTLLFERFISKERNEPPDTFEILRGLVFERARSS